MYLLIFGLNKDEDNSALNSIKRNSKSTLFGSSEDDFNITMGCFNSQCKFPNISMTKKNSSFPVVSLILKVI